MWFSGNGTLATTIMHIHVSNDRFNQTFPGGRLTLSVVHFATGASKAVDEIDVPQIEWNSGMEVVSTPLARLWLQGPPDCRTLEDCFLVSRPSNPRTGSESLDEAMGFPVQFKNVSLMPASVQVTGWHGTNSTVSFTVVSNVVTAHLTFYTSSPGYFEPNTITLLPGTPLNVSFHAVDNTTTISTIKSSLRLNCLNNIGSCLAG